jgi:uncharacterized protein YjbI with pentapeptide repeats
MANEEHIVVPRRGASFWNEWRRKNPAIQPDLLEADLRGVHLFRADLREAILVGAHLEGG